MERRFALGTQIPRLRQSCIDTQRILGQMISHAATAAAPPEMPSDRMRNFCAISESRLQEDWGISGRLRDGDVRPEHAILEGVWERGGILIGVVRPTGGQIRKGELSLG